MSSSRLSRLGFVNDDRTRMPVQRRIRSRGVPNALQDHPVACTADLGEATEVASDLLGDLAIEPHADGVDDFLATMNAVRLVDVTMAYLDLACASTLRMHRSADCYFVHMTTSGHGVVTVGGERTDLSAFFALVVSPHTAYVLDLEQDSPQLIIRIERAALERQLTRMLGSSLDKPVQFEPLGDLTADGAVRWHGALQILSSEIVSPGSLIHRGIGADSLEELIISTLLHIQPSTYSERLHAGPRRTGRPAVRRSMDHIEQHLAEPISMADLAEASGMSIRSIQAGFREDLETTPIAFIRDRRLDRVRHTLMESAPGDGTTVTAAAERWGFTHLGSFSVLYRKRFGESPSQTLRR